MVDSPVSDQIRELGAVPTATGPETLTGLISGIAEDAQRLIRQQYQMLRAEVRDDIRRTKSAVKYLGIGIAGLVIGFLFLVVSLPLFLNWAFEMPPWAGWAIIGGSGIVVGGIALYVGKHILARFNPLPDKTLNALEENLSWITNHRN